MPSSQCLHSVAHRSIVKGWSPPLTKKCELPLQKAGRDLGFRGSGGLSDGLKDAKGIGTTGLR